MNLKKLSLSFSSIFCLCSFITPSIAIIPVPEGYTREQVVVISRHGIRAPINSYPGARIQDLTPHSWPQWSTPEGELTAKGGELEERLGHYFSRWLTAEPLFTIQQSPACDEVHVASNSMQRTRETATRFIQGFNPGCAIAIESPSGSGDNNPLYNPILRDSSPEFTQRFKQSLLADWGTFISGLKESFERIEQLLDYTHSDKFQKDGGVHLRDQPHEVLLQRGHPSHINGAHRLAITVTDNFIAHYYNNSGAQETAWGQIQSEDDWRLLMQAKNEYLPFIVSRDPVVIRHLASPMLNYIQQQLNIPGRRFNLLVGHDWTITTLFAALSVNPYQLPGQVEQTPISGKVVIQRLRDREGRRWVRIEYVYPTMQQVHEGAQFDHDSPPQHFLLQLAGLRANPDGLYAWDEFQQLLQIDFSQCQACSLDHCQSE